jgi:hypothetical protein
MTGQPSAGAPRLGRWEPQAVHRGTHWIRRRHSLHILHTQIERWVGRESVALVRPGWSTTGDEAVKAGSPVSKAEKRPIHPPCRSKRGVPPGGCTCAARTAGSAVAKHRNVLWDARTRDDQ